MATQVKQDAQPPSEKQGNEPPTYATPIVGDYMPLHPSGRSWEISREQVTVIKVIGKGAFSQVAQAIVRDMRGRRENITVAVKMLKGKYPLIFTIHHFYYLVIACRRGVFSFFAFVRRAGGKK